MTLQLVQQQGIGINQQALDDWVQYRAERKKPLSQMAMNRTLKMLARYDESHQMHIVDTAIQNDWIGLHPVDKPKTKTTSEGDAAWLDTI